MENVDIERMRRVMDRLYPPGPPPEKHHPFEDHRPPPAKPEDTACRLLETEQELYGMILLASQKSRECRRVLGGVRQRSARRSARLRSLCFLTFGPGTPPGKRAQQGREGVLHTLRRIVRILEELSDRYHGASVRFPARRQLYEGYARECRSDAKTAEYLLERAFR